jgi:class 3 adenylate cyclase
MTCPACGVAAPAAARFCPACGERLAGGLEERRVVTVLFADLVDSTSLVESLDPEAARDLLNETFRRLAAEVRRFGGTLERYNAVARRALERATAMGAHALVRHLTQAEGVGR